jgi:CRISPR/Cas system-associated exonuclease Cas4 (RecB family)
MSDQIDHLSISQINEYLGCSQQYFYHRIVEIEALETPGALVIGSAIHLAFETYNKNKALGESTSCEQMVLVFSEYLDEQTSQSHVNFGRSSADELKEKCQTWFNVFLSEQDQNEKVVSVEESFRINLPSLTIPVVGRVDLVVEDSRGDIIVIDYKSAASKPSKSDIDSNMQMTLYGIWAKSRWPDRNIKLRMDYLIKSVKAPAFYKYETQRCEIHELELTALFRKVYNHILMLKSDVIDPLPNRSWKCSGCGYRTLCISISSAA